MPICPKLLGVHPRGGVALWRAPRSLARRPADHPLPSVFASWIGPASMTTEKRILIAAVLSAVFMSWYAQAVLKGSGISPRRPAPSVASTGTVEPPAPQLVPPPGIEEETLVLESPRIELEIGKTSAAIRSVVLKDFIDASRIGPLRIRSEQPLVSALIGNAPLPWELINQTQTAVSFKAKDDNSNNYYISFEIDRANNVVDIVLRDEKLNYNTDKKVVSLLTTWAKGDKLDDRY